MSEVMTDRQVALFEQGFASYADGIPHDHVPAFPDIEERRWWLKGWYASKRTNEPRLRSRSGGLIGG